MLEVKWGLMSLLLILEPFNKANKKTTRTKENQKKQKGKDKGKSDKKQIKEKFDNTFSKEWKKALKEQRVKKDFSRKKNIDFSCCFIQKLPFKSAEPVSHSGLSWH